VALITAGTMSLSSNEASARGFHGGGFHGGGFHGGGFHGGGFHGGGFHGGFHGGGFHHASFRHHHKFYHPYWPHHRHVYFRPHWRPGIAIAAPAVGVVSYGTAPTYNRCTCLTKEYTPEGAVVFKDICTQESAMNPPANAAAAYEQGAPQVQGSLQVPIQQLPVQPQLIQPNH
jgi:hypothetical protein